MARLHCPSGQIASAQSAACGVTARSVAPASVAGPAGPEQAGLRYSPAVDWQGVELVCSGLVPQAAVSLAGRRFQAWRLAEPVLPARAVALAALPDSGVPADWPVPRDSDWADGFRGRAADSSVDGSSNCRRNLGGWYREPGADDTRSPAVDRGFSTAPKRHGCNSIAAFPNSNPIPSIPTDGLSP